MRALSGYLLDKHCSKSLWANLAMMGSHEQNEMAVAFWLISGQNLRIPGDPVVTTGYLVLVIR